MTAANYERYASDLADELELRDVPPEAVDRIVREVRSHSADSGEDPRESFGAPAEYADQFVPRSLVRRLLVPIVVLSALLGAGAGLLLLSGAFGLIEPTAQLGGLLPPLGWRGAACSSAS